MTCYANPMIMMQSQFDQSMLTDSQLQDEIAKTFLYAGAASKDQERATPRFQQQETLQDSGPIISKSSGSTGMLSLDSADCNPLPLGKKRNALDREEDIKLFKKQRIEAGGVPIPKFDATDAHDRLSEPPTVPESKKGISTFSDNDVLSGRGGGTNVHPGNRNFRDLINLHRRDYLQAKKNDKPSISRAIVKVVRDSGGRFLKKDEKANLWFEIGDTQAREKTSQALRQRAPEMRRLMFESEQGQSQATTTQGQLRQMIMGGIGRMNPGLNNIAGGGMNAMNSFGGMNTFSLMQSATSAEGMNELNGGVSSGFNFPGINKNGQSAASDQTSYSLQFFKDA